MPHHVASRCHRRRALPPPLLPAVWPLHWLLLRPTWTVQKLHKGVIRDEELYRMKKQQLMAGQLSPAAPAQVAAPR